jgi:hypothetical protein
MDLVLGLAGATGTVLFFMVVELIQWLKERRSKGGTLPDMIRTYEDGGEVVMIHLSGRHTVKRPGETWSEATNRLTEGEDL